MANVRLKKSLGQHLLRNPGIVTQMIKKSNIDENDIVLEIGPGTGNLTIKLLEVAKKVIVIEKDREMANELRSRLSESEHFYKLKIIVGDALKTEFPFFNLCVSNIPYQITAPLIFKLLNHDYKKIVLLVQKEVSMRLTSRPGDKIYCRLAATTQLVAKPSHLIEVKKNNFNPPPKVDSAVVALDPRAKTGINFKEYEKIVRFCFTRKNKKITSNLYNKTVLENLKIEKEQMEDILNKTGLAEKRAIKMDIEDFLLLLLELKKINAKLI